MTALQFHVNEVFDIPTRGGVIAVCSPSSDVEVIGIPRLKDEASGHFLRVLGVDRPTPRTLRTGETIFVIDRADNEYVQAGRNWTVEDQ